MGIRFQAEAQMAELGERAAYVLAQEGWHPGVIGIVASRLVERSGRPVVLIALDGDTGKASGRSVEAFDLLAGLTACGEHLLRYGGHRAAAGLEIERGRVADFAERAVRPRRARARARRTWWRSSAWTRSSAARSSAWSSRRSCRRWRRSVAATRPSR